jgi:hypothetical protein
MGGTSGQPESQSDKGKIILIGIIIVIVAIVGYTIYSGGMTSLQALGSKVLKWIIIIAIFGFVVWVVFKILQKPKIDLVASDMRNIIDAGTLSKPPMLKDLYFTGDKEHGEFRVGKITGYCQLQSYKDLNKISGLTEDELEALRLKGTDPSKYIVKEDCFIFKRFPFPASMFESPKVLRTLENEHSQLVGDVKIYGVSMIKKYNYYWPNRGHLDIARIDHSIIKEAWRGQIHEFLKDMVAISQKSSGLDADHRKELENRKLLKLPGPLGEQGTREGK